MGEIHQFLCTHCNAATSAFHRQPDREQDVIGSSLRASSLELTEAERVFEQLRGYLHYTLPSWAGPDGQDQGRGTAPAAPQRMICGRLPQTGQSFVGLVSFRPFDCTGKRPRSYFAHFLVEGAGASWVPPRELLRLWRAPGWREEDAPVDSLPHRLVPLDSLESLLEGRTPLIDDRAVARFLFAEDLPPGLVPGRWASRGPRGRQALLRLVLDRVLATADDQDRLYLLAEPGFAALLMYAALRLLPTVGFARELAFSTYDEGGSPTVGGHARPTAVLAPSGRFRDDDHRDNARGAPAVVDTFDATAGLDPGRSRWSYVDLVFASLTGSTPEDPPAGRWEAVDRFLERFKEPIPDGPRTLSNLADLQVMAARLCDPGHARPIASFPKAHEEMVSQFQDRFPQLPFGEEIRATLLNYLRGAVAAHLRAAAAAGEGRRIGGSGQFLAVNELFLSEPLERRWIRFALMQLLGPGTPRERIEEIHASSTISFPFQVAVLLRGAGGEIPEPKARDWDDALIARVQEPPFPQYLSAHLFAGSRFADHLARACSLDREGLPLLRFLAALPFVGSRSEGRLARACGAPEDARLAGEIIEALYNALEAEIRLGQMLLVLQPVLHRGFFTPTLVGRLHRMADLLPDCSDPGTYRTELHALKVANRIIRQEELDRKVKVWVELERRFRRVKSAHQTVAWRELLWFVRRIDPLCREGPDGGRDPEGLLVKVFQFHVCAIDFVVPLKRRIHELCSRRKAGETAAFRRWVLRKRCAEEGFVWSVKLLVVAALLVLLGPYLPESWLEPLGRRLWTAAESVTAVVRGFVPY